jgi:hypothetical protein
MYTKYLTYLRTMAIKSKILSHFPIKLKQCEGTLPLSFLAYCSRVKIYISYYIAV